MYRPIKNKKNKATIKQLSQVQISGLPNLSVILLHLLYTSHKINIIWEIILWKNDDSKYTREKLQKHWT